MFRKQLKIKNFSNLKSSDKKKLHAKIRKIFSINENDILSLFNPKENITSHRLLATSGQVVTVYASENRPLFFETKEALYPTIYSLWICPNILPCIPMHEQLIQKLVNGADLMIPGVQLNSESYEGNEILEQTLVYVCTLQNVSAVAVGITTVSSKHMISGNKGKAVHIYHTVGDELCKLFNLTECIPDLGPLSSNNTDANLVEEEFRNMPLPSSMDLAAFPESSSESLLTSSTWTTDIEEKSTSSVSAGVDSIDNGKEEMTMDELVIFCFLKALKTSASKMQLPILTNVFYKNHMLEAVPRDLSMDIKKSKYKKLSNFLSEIEEKGLISIKTEKGVQTITLINYNHEIIKGFKVENQDAISNKKSPPKFEVEEKYVVNGSILPIFSKYNYKKGDHLTDKEARSCVTTYFKSGNLNPNKDQYVTLNDELCEILGTKEYRISWKQLFAIVFKKMGNAYSIKTPYNGVVSGKGKLPCIKLSTVSKASNKKVTLVDNLECYGINIYEFSKQCQHGVAASSTINSVPNKVPQFQIQGNQKKFITQLLIGDYGIPKRFIEGCEDQKKK